MKTVIGIDVGGSTTKIVGFRYEGEERKLVNPICVKATDPVTSIYGAFGKFTLENGLKLDDINKVMVTGGGASYMSEPIYSLDCKSVPEFDSIGLGGLYLSGLDEAVVVSMGTGTALVHAKNSDGKVITQYLGGTGVGGGTLIGLSKKMLGVDTIEHIEQLCEGGNLDKIDLRIKDISKNQAYKGVNEDLTASNFGKLSDIADNHDIALGIANMVSETIAMISIFAARSYGIKDIILIGNLTSLKPIKKTFDDLEDSFGVRFIIPEMAQFGTVIGAALCEEYKKG
jgi:type II pantothenate kinase